MAKHETLSTTSEVSQAALARKGRQDGAELAIRRVTKDKLNAQPVEANAEVLLPVESLYIFGESAEIYDNVELRVQTGASRSGMADAAHAVTVVDAHFSGPDGEETVQAAAKHYAKRPFAERLQRVGMELDVMSDLSSHDIPAFEPIAVAVMPDSAEGEAGGDILLFTRYEQGMITLDNLPWGLGLSKENVETARDIMGALAEFNTLGYRHRDAKVKNVAQRESDGRVAMVDFETTQRVDHNDPIQAAITVDEDFKTMTESLVKKGFFANAEANDRQLVLSGLAEAYADAWTNAPDEVQNAVMTGLLDACDQLAK